MPRQLDSHGIILLLCAMNMLNYIDRGIIPGAPESFQGFIMQTLHVSVASQSLYFGLLASAFIASYSISSMVFGYLSISTKPFHVIAFGMSLWCVAVVCCGASKRAESYYLLLFGRVLSGVGEASFQCTATPFINTYAPPKKRSLWMGFYLGSITVGTAIGYMYGSNLAASSWGWPTAFYLEAIVMLALIVLVLAGIPSEFNRVPLRDEQELNKESPTMSKPIVKCASASSAISMTSSSTFSSSTVNHKKNKKITTSSSTATTNNNNNRYSEFNTTTVNDDDEQEQDEEEHPSDNSDTDLITEELVAKSFYQEVLTIFRNRTFTLITFGYASYTFTVAGLSVFCPILLIGLGLFETETEVSFVFGALVAVTGTIGAPMGGILLDRMAFKVNNNSKLRCLKALQQMLYLMTIGYAMELLAYMMLPSKILFLSILALAFLSLFALSAASSVAVMELFPPSRRGFAIAANTMVIHVLGDVPSPVVLGWLKDTWAPKCGTIEHNNKLVLNPECERQRTGLMHVILLAILWMTWGVVLWFLAYQNHKNTIAKDAQRGDHNDKSKRPISSATFSEQDSLATD